MRVVFVERENNPERLVCEAEVHFEEQDLVGLKLVGFCLWKDAEGEVYVTFPSRAFGAGCERRYFDYIRGAEDVSATRGLKVKILEAFKAWKQEKAQPVPVAPVVKESLKALARKAQVSK